MTELLNLKGVLVTSQRIHNGIGIILQTESIESYSLCPRCCTKSEKIHQNHRHIIKDLPFGEQPVFLEINRRQFKCSRCQKPFSEELDYVGKKRTYTKRLAQQIIQEVLENDIHSVASKGIVTTEEIERMLKDASSELCDSKPSNLKRLGIDEIALVLKLIEVKEVSLSLKEMHELKEKIRKIFNKTDDWYTGVFKIGMWLSRAKKYFLRSHNTFIGWFDEIIAYFDNGTTSGTVEGINNKLKLIKRSGYGFRNFDNFRIRCLLNWT
nr:transposase [Synechocystis sp. PCC 7509]